MSEVQQLKPNSRVSIEISTEFYRNFQQALLVYYDVKSEAEIKVAVEKINTGKELDPFEAGLETLLVLTRTMEDAFVKGGFVETLTVPALPAQ